MNTESSISEIVTHAVSYLNSKLVKLHPTIGVILGSGWGMLASEVEQKQEILYADIPDFPVTTVPGHEGKLVFGRMGDQQVMMMQGRFHFYEGYAMATLRIPALLMKAMGVETMIITSASGGVNSRFKRGDLMVIEDHINLVRTIPLVALSNKSSKKKKKGIYSVYDPGLISKVQHIAAQKQIMLHKGVYVFVTGPSFETPAEINMIREIGGDVVGMSTVPEALVAVEQGISVIALTYISNLGSGMTNEPLRHDDVIEAMDIIRPKVVPLLTELIGSI